MQTFLPYASFQDSAVTLDRQRLGKQRVEAWQILNALDGNSKGWVNHPITRMWAGYEQALCEYGEAICFEWISRGYKDTLMERFSDRLAGETSWDYPSWLGNADLHLSHRSNLIRKFPDHYSKLWADVPNDLPYVWFGGDK